MILTITANPSIDISYKMPSFTLDQVNRVSDISKTAGGKGLNVTRVLKQLNADVLASGFLGGQHGAFVANLLDQDAIKHQFCPIEGETRDSIAVIHDGGLQTEILESGPEIQSAEVEAFKALLANLLPQVDLITISGSLPRGLEKTFYADIVSQAKAAGVRVLLDTSGETLVTTVKAADKPYLIKPNETEIEALIHRPIDGQDMVSLAQALQASVFDGLMMVVVSLGKDGALVKYDGQFYRASVPVIDVVNPVGSGDSTLAGFAYGLSQAWPIKRIIQSGMACGILNAMHPQTGHIFPDQFEAMCQRVQVEKI